MPPLSHTMKGTVDLSGHWGQIMDVGVYASGSLVVEPWSKLYPLAFPNQKNNFIGQLWRHNYIPVRQRPPVAMVIIMTAKEDCRTGVQSQSKRWIPVAVTAPLKNTVMQFSTQLSDTVKALCLVSFLYLPAFLFILCSSCGLFLLTPVRPTILVLSHVAACFFFRKTLRTQRAQRDKQAATPFDQLAPYFSAHRQEKKKTHDIGWNEQNGDCLNEKTGQIEFSVKLVKWKAAAVASRFNPWLSFS